jgi:hypothetical protein
LLVVALTLGLAFYAQGAKKVDTFFAGTVAEITDRTVVISRTIQKKIDKRSFQLTPDTKIEGRLRPRVRVTVRYISGEDGYIATLIVVRPAQPAKKN